MKTKKPVGIIFIYFTIIFIIFLVLNFEKNIKIDEYLSKKTNQIYLEYKAVYSQYKTLSRFIYETKINTKHIINVFQNATVDEKNKDEIRTKLLEVLKNDYDIFKNYNVKQLHFHLPNSESFLRMHRPNKYGDNLKNIRLTVDYVNDNKKFIEGFEEGRIFNGYRFVYPLFTKENKHIGSVEISFSALAMINVLNSTYDVETDLIIKKDLVEEKVFNEEKQNYTKSEYKDFYYEKSISKKYPKKDKEFIIEDISTKILKKDPFSIYNEKDNIVKTFIPLQNPVSKKVIASIVINKYSLYIPNKYANFYLLFSIFSILLGIISIYIYKLKVTKTKLLSFNSKLDKKVQKEISKSRKKDVQILNQAKLAAVGETLNNIAHQWRQPLSVITTSASGLKLKEETKKLEEKDISHYTSIILKQSINLSNTIEFFKEIIEERDVKKNVCIQERVRKIIDIVKKGIGFENIKIHTNFEKEDIFITIIIAELSQVLMYIINNAKDSILESNKDKKLIILSIYKKNDKVIITIQDTGTGIKDKALIHLFEPYFTTKHKSVGTGIGLYMSHEIIVNKLKGNLSAKNTSLGAKFIIELPVK